MTFVNGQHDEKSGHVATFYNQSSKPQFNFGTDACTRAQYKSVESLQTIT